MTSPTAPTSAPMRHFASWLNDAVAAEGARAKHMVVSTASLSGRVASRVVVLRGFDDGGLVFTTGAGSRKAAELAAAPFAALLFAWTAPGTPQRQVRVEGAALLLPPPAAAALFARRSRDAQIAEWASEHMGDELADAAAAAAHADRVAAVRARFAAVDPIPVPPFFVAFKTRCERIEFWEGSDIVGKPHERIVYQLVDPSRETGEYRMSRLAA
ncbi:hypothetical protein BDR26DRAFT_413833 [Obelidium mucronatum]|nr:hypothetical protein BDR26DRAFT_413833 [Obelidium mucronatum]